MIVQTAGAFCKRSTVDVYLTSQRCIRPNAQAAYSVDGCTTQPFRFVYAAELNPAVKTAAQLLQILMEELLSASICTEVLRNAPGLRKRS